MDSCHEKWVRVTLLGSSLWARSFVVAYILSVAPIHLTHAALADLGGDGVLEPGFTILPTLPHP